MKKIRLSLLHKVFFTTIALTSLFCSCIQNVKYPETYFANDGDINISLTGTGYGQYSQLLPLYSNLALTSILKNDDSYFSVKTNSTDSSGNTVNTVIITLTFPQKEISKLYTSIELPVINGVSVFRVEAFQDTTSVKSIVSSLQPAPANKLPSKTVETKTTGIDSTGKQTVTTTKTIVLTNEINNSNTYEVVNEYPVDVTANKIVLTLQMNKYNASGEQFNSEIKIKSLNPAFK